jgi:hypothetical protein
MSILANAVESIQIGVEDYKSADSRRHLSSVRNLSAGILLLFKEKLRQLSPPHAPELLFRRDLLPLRAPNGEVIFTSKGRKTVDVQQIKERFGSMGVTVNWKLYESVNEIRNDVEHYYSSQSAAVIREVLARSFVLIRDFVVRELHEEPLTLLGSKCWNDLLQVAEVFEREEADCQQAMKAIDWTYQTLRECICCADCPSCGSPLLRPLEEGAYKPALKLVCASCGEGFGARDVIEQCVEEFLGVDAYIAAKEGDEPPYGQCPHCDKLTFIVAENVCLVCEETLDYKQCGRCAETLSLDEQELEGFCSYCRNVMDKVWAE